MTPLDCDLYVGNEALSRMLAERLGSGNASAASERADGEGEIARARSQARPLVETRKMGTPGLACARAQGMRTGAIKRLI